MPYYAIGFTILDEYQNTFVLVAKVVTMISSIISLFQRSHSDNFREVLLNEEEIVENQIHRGRGKTCLPESSLLLHCSKVSYILGFESEVRGNNVGEQLCYKLFIII